MKLFFVFCFFVSALFAYSEGDAVYRTVELSVEEVGSLEIGADVSVVGVDPLKLRVKLVCIRASAGLMGSEAIDSSEEHGESRWEWWRQKRLKHAMGQPFYLTLEDGTFSLACDDLDERYSVWPELLKALKQGSVFDLLFGREFCLVGRDVQEGLLFQQGDDTICVEKVTDDQIVASLQGDVESAVLTWDRRHPLMFEAKSTYEGEAKAVALAIQSFTDTPK